jgi:hypothetical protein
MYNIQPSVSSIISTQSNQQRERKTRIDDLVVFRLVLWSCLRLLGQEKQDQEQADWLGKSAQTRGALGPKLLNYLGKTLLQVNSD